MCTPLLDLTLPKTSLDRSHKYRIIATNVHDHFVDQLVCDDRHRMLYQDTPAADTKRGTRNDNQ